MEVPMRRSPGILAGLALVTAFATANAQRSRTIAGTVTDSGGRPVPGAEIRIAGRTGGVTDDAGRFRLSDVARDSVLIEARRVGFAPARLSVPTGSDTTVAITLAPISQELDAVKVSRRPVEPHLRAFEERMLARERGAGGGFFITAAEIERRAPPRATSIFDNISGIHVLRVGPRNFSLFGTSRAMGTSRSKFGTPDGQCEATVFLDGIKLVTGGDVLSSNARTGQVVLERGVAIDDLVAPSSIAGIEVYSSPNTAPTQYQVVNNGCAIVLIWTKNGLK